MFTNDNHTDHLKKSSSITYWRRPRWPPLRRNTDDRVQNNSSTEFEKVKFTPILFESSNSGINQRPFCSAANARITGDAIYNQIL
jgi:hypothetical protein